MHEGEISTRLGLTGWPAVAEEAIIARDVLLAEHVGSRLHICHVSTAGSVDVLRQAKARGVQVTAEVTPHHLLLTDEKAVTYDPVYKVNPPLRTAADVAALRTALAEGVVDIVATDQPRTPWRTGSASGRMPGRECSAWRRRSPSRWTCSARGGTSSPSGCPAPPLGSLASPNTATTRRRGHRRT